MMKKMRSKIFLVFTMMSLILRVAQCDYLNPLDIENIDSEELTDANLRRAVSALSLVSGGHETTATTNDFSAELLSSSSKDLQSTSSTMLSAAAAAAAGGGGGRCEAITVPMCRSLEYNMTSMPNQFEHTSQSEAAAEAHQFWALVEFNCAPELKFFLCSMYTPICIPGYSKPIKACRSVCVRARLGCERYMKKFGFDWPDHMRCELFPEYGQVGGEVCMDPMDANQQEKSASTSSPPPSTASGKKKLVVNHNLKPIKPNRGGQSVNSREDIIRMELFGQIDDKKSLSCQDPFLPTAVDQEVTTAGIPNCAQSCKSVYFNESEQNFTNYWLLVWSSLCLISSICTTCTFLIEPSRFKYPEKPIIYLSICYLFVSLGYLLRFVVGHEKMACESDGVSLRSIESSATSSSAWPCLVSFTLIYYFTVASSVWWCVISFTWFLAAGLKWCSESIAHYSTHFHTISWSLPLLQTLVVLSKSLVDADPLSGLCGLGNTSVQSLRVYSIVPSTAYLLVGAGFLVAGFVALFKLRRSLQIGGGGSRFSMTNNNKMRRRSSQRRSNKLDKLMIRVGVFSILFTVPATCVIACQYYESVYREDWERAAICRNTRRSFDDAVMCAGVKADDKPDFWVFILKYFMSMIIGVTSGFWIWSRKSLNSWQRFLNKICGCGVNNIDEPVMSKLTPNSSSECTESSSHDGSICCLTLRDLFRCNKQQQLRCKDSVVYFQTTCVGEEAARNVPNFYDVPHNNQAQQRQHYSNASDDFVLYKKATLHNAAASVPTSCSTQFYVAGTSNLLQTQPGAVPFYDGYHGVTRSTTTTTTATNTTASTNSSSLPSSIVSTTRR